MTRAFTIFTVSVAVLLVSACGSTTETATDGGTTGTTDAGSTKDAGTSDAGSSDAGVSDAGSTDAGSTADAGTTTDAGVCASTVTTAQTLPLDMYIMLDRSSSMSSNTTTTDAGTITRWAAVTSALETFISSNADADAGLSVGLQYFPYSSSSTACTDETLYATPAIAIGSLTASGQVSSLLASIEDAGTIQGTPTAAALQGAIDYCSTYATANSSHVVITVLATDGEPAGCTDNSITTVEAIADAGYHASPSIRTFVIGVGDAGTNLNGIAAAGGTTSAIMVDSSSDVDTLFLAALESIRSTALACTYALPATDGGTADYSTLNVEYTPGDGGTTQTIPEASDSTNCPTSTYAWYYDSATSPTKIILCPTTCTAISADTSGTVNISMGCTTTVTTAE